MQRLGVPHRQNDRGATPGVLRGSGATFLYLECEDVQLVAWRGRWAKLKLTCEGRVSVLSRAWKTNKERCLFRQKPFRCVFVMSECMWLLLKSREGRKFRKRDFLGGNPTRGLGEGPQSGKVCGCDLS